LLIKAIARVSGRCHFLVKRVKRDIAKERPAEGIVLGARYLRPDHLQGGDRAELGRLRELRRGGAIV
jgi:hypothetical protein